MTLYVVATPVGHLEDVTHRAARVLAECDAILAEDTRHTRKLTEALGVRTPLRSYHDHSSPEARDRIVAELVAGADFALVSDAGTPCISDPGYALVREARAHGVDVVPVPGPSSLTAFLSAAGLPTDRFQFVGFAPRKVGARRDAVRQWLAYGGTTVAFESPARVVDLLVAIAREAPAREIVVGRELTKRFEEFLVGPANTVAETLASRDGVRGEIVVGVRGSEETAAPETAEIDAWIRALSEAGLGTKALSQTLANRLGGRVDQYYKRAIELREE